MKKPLFSVIVPVKKINQFITKEIAAALENQTLSSWELIIIPDKFEKGDLKETDLIKIVESGDVPPGKKRNLGVSQARGKYLAFLDDDAYPNRYWLENAESILKRKVVGGVCGPGITPSTDSFLCQLSGWVWASFWGSGGAGRYRGWPEKEQEVDDYPSFNLIIKKKIFKETSGFDNYFWPGEDTKLCEEIVYKLKKRIVYSPQVLVYHHRRPVLKAHLRQLGRYGHQRGYFARILPRTSLRIGYLLPPLFFLGLFLGPVLYFLLRWPLLIWIYFISLGLYLMGLVYTFFEVFQKSKRFWLSLLVLPVILVSHLYNGMMFLRGFLGKKGLAS